MIDLIGNSNITIALISLLGGAISVISALIIGILGFKTSQIGASDEIASGSKTLLGEYRLELDKLHTEIKNLKIAYEIEINSLLFKYATLELKYDTLVTEHLLSIECNHELAKRLAELEKKE